MADDNPAYKIVSTHTVIDGDEGPTVGLDGAVVTAAVMHAGGTSKLSKSTDFAGVATLNGRPQPQFGQQAEMTGSTLTFSRAGYGTLAVSSPKKKYTLVEGTTDELTAKWWPAKVTLYGKD